MQDNDRIFPISLQTIKDLFDATADNSNCKCDETYDVHQYLDKLAAEFGDRFDPREFLLMDCPHCGHVTYYDGGFTDSCKCCNYYNIADHSDDAYTVQDYWDGQFWMEIGYNQVDNFNLPKKND